MSFQYGVKQERDWNALTDEEFRSLIRSDFETNYPTELRYPPSRLWWKDMGPWYLRMAAKGWICPAWPVEYGGMGLSPAKLLIYYEEQERWGIARFQDHGISNVGPTLIKWGTDEQRRKYLPGILSCEHIWCQGYSEPNSGSDLASLRTKAERDGDHFVINGQKIWTTGAFDATHLYLLARTDPAAKKQAGISMFIFPMNTPGVSIRPIVDIAGHTEFCETLLENVRVSAECLVGELNNGWTIAKSLLGFERIGIGSPKMPGYGLVVLKKVAEATGAIKDPVFRDKYHALRMDVAHLTDIYSHYAGMMIRGETLGSDVSMLKIWATESFQRIADLIVETAGPAGGLADDVDLGVPVNVLAPFYKSRLPTIYGGTNEVQRNIIAKQVLELPS
jgi:alkylation response protein AidB-like acyl-CoA dehydrogenase